MQRVFNLMIKKPGIKRPNLRFAPLEAPHIIRSFTMSRVLKREIVLNEKEASIKHLLVQFCNHYNAQNTAEKHLELRITGGWVRDKLLGNESNDLDIAINLLSGEEFASILLDYLNENHPELKLKGLHTIKKNPEKSKHLETCTTQLFGLDIDFVNLRSEQYSENSRVPVIEYGTAEEDALRRDATLNALFYNLNVDKIEDFTKKGLDDLKNGVLRTPLPPLQTFLDDPLRVLRLIRFASRFDFTFENATLEAMKDPSLRSTLVNKISRERVGVEVEKILKSQNPEYGFRILSHVGLNESIFTTGLSSEVLAKYNNANVLETLEKTTKDLYQHVALVTSLSSLFCSLVDSSEAPLFKGIYETVFKSKELRKLFWLAVILHPFRNIHILGVSKLMSGSATTVFLRDGLRFGKSDIKAVSQVVDEPLEKQKKLEELLSDPQNAPRSSLGLYVREFGDFAGLNLVYQCFFEVLKHYQNAPFEHVAPKLSESDLPHGDANTSTAVIAKYERLLAAVVAKGLQNVSTLKPIVDGKAISQFLGKKPGPWMAEVVSHVLVWQLDHPEGSREECLEYVKGVS